MSGFIKGNKLAILFLLMTASLLPQGWNSIQQTAIPFSLYSKLDLCTNTNGNNVLITYSDYPTYYLKYYLLSTSGSIIRSSDPFETQEVEFASIDGNNDKVYVAYKLGNTIKTRKSTNGGISWINMQDLNIGSNPCNNVDIVWGKDDNALHVVWATQDEYPFFKAYYQRLGSNNVWSPKETVTDGNYVGGFPTVSKSNNRVHVSYNTGFSQYPLSNVGDAKSRDKYITTWQTPQLVLSSDSKCERIHAGSNKLFDFYYQNMDWYCNLLVKERNFDEIYWSSPEILDYIADPEKIVSAANTYDGKSHIVYIIGGGVGYRSYDSENWSSESSILNTYYSPRISSVSNDLYVVSGGSGYIYFRQYDTNPLAPGNLQVTHSQNNHPYLTWSANKEPDIDHYIVEKTYGGSWTFLTQTTNTHYEDPNESYCTALPPAECSGERTVYYRVTAVDKHPYSSIPSEVRTVVLGYPDKEIAQTSEIPDEYKLTQNYPNPFNPSTLISYSLKAPGYVKLTVYDMLGREVAELVNENQPEGNYTVEFNSKDLPSGIYVYKITAGKFSDMKKMLFVK